MSSYLRENANNPVASIRELAKITLFNYAIGNCDNHLKNLSLLYGENWLDVSLAPAYDLVCTTWYPDLSREMGMAISGVSDIDAVSADDVRSCAAELGISVRELRRLASDIVERIDDAIEAAVVHAPGSLDEIDWKADELREDMAPRLRVLAQV